MMPETLTQLLARRNAALVATGGSNLQLRRMKPADRQRVDAASRDLAETTAAIVARLKEFKRPIRVGAVVLHLTADRDGFVEMDPETERPVYACEADQSRGWKNLLYRYPAGRQNVPEMVP